MSWHYSQALVAAFSAESSVGSEPSAPSNTIPTHGMFWSPDKTTDACIPSRSGMMYAPSTASHGAALLTWYQEASRARTSLAQEKALESTGSEADSGGKCGGLLARLDRASCSWKTPQLSLFAEGSESLPSWPRWATWDETECWELSTPALPTSESESGSWPTVRSTDGERGGRGDLIQAVRGNPNSHYKLWQTPVADDAIERTAGKWNSRGEPKLSAEVKLWPTPKASAAGPDFAKMTRSGTGISLQTAVALWPTPTVCGNHNRKGASANSGDGLSTAAKSTAPENGGALNPTWVEWLMGWPLGWTDCAASATDKFRQWCASHGIS